MDIEEVPDASVYPRFASPGSGQERLAGRTEPRTRWLSDR